MNRFFIGKGNNSMLVRSVIKQRWWWSMNESENFYQVNFLWTQWRKNKHLCVLDSKKPVTNPAMLELKKQVEEERYCLSDSEHEVSSPKKNPEQASGEETRQFPRIYNRLEDNFHLSNKKALFWNLCEYYNSLSCYKGVNKDPWDALPVTFHIDNGLDDPEYSKFLEYFKTLERKINDLTERKYQVLETRRKEEERKRVTKRRDAKGRGSKSTETESSSSEASDSDDSGEDEESSDDDEFKIPKNIWIVKPGENSNRGNGIQV